MMVDGPGTIGLHPKGWNEVEGGRRQLFCFAMQSQAGVPMRLAAWGGWAAETSCHRTLQD